MRIIDWSSDLCSSDLVGRKVRVTKVPFSASPKALIKSHSRGFVKIVSDPATGVVLGGSVVGRHAAEPITVLAVRSEESRVGRGWVSTWRDRGSALQYKKKQQLMIVYIKKHKSR